MKAIYFIIFYFIALTSYAQTAHFSYDASGNRISRWLEVKAVKQTSADSAVHNLPELIPTEKAELLGDVQIYPNPAKRYLNIDITNLGEATAKGNISDINGRTVLSFENLSTANTLNVETLAPGTYLLRVECRGERKVWKVIVSD